MGIGYYKKSKIIAIPFAGGNQYSFQKIQQYLSKGFEWVTLELPGRGGRFTEPLLNNVPDMVADLYRQIKKHIVSGDYMLYGHSLGTLLGYELMRRITEDGLKLPVCLFFTGRGAPSYNRFTSKKSVLAQVPFWEEVHKMGGMPKDFFSQQDLMDLYYPILRSDFKAVENYVYYEMNTPFSVPLYVIMGDEEIGEEAEKTPMREMKAWVNETNSKCSFEIIPGDHFFIFDNAKMTAQKIMHAYEACTLTMV